MRNRILAVATLTLSSALGLVACSGDTTAVDLCADSHCTQPLDHCDGTVAVTYTGPATCNPDTGACQNVGNTVRTECADTTQVCGSTAGVVGCVAPPECISSTTCTAVPTSACDVDGNLVTYSGVCDATGTCTYPGTPASCGVDQICETDACRAMTTAEEIDLVHANMGGTGLVIPVNGAIVTLIQPNVNNDAGFFVQAGPTGPAMFVKVDPTTLSTVPAVGDTVSFTVTDVYQYPPTTATAITDFSVGVDTTDVSTWPQDVTAIDVVTDRADYEAELITFDGTLSSALRTGGTGYLQATLDTTAVSGNSNLTFRAPTDVMNTLDLQNGCDISVSLAVVWAFSATAELTAFTAGDITVNSCPAPTVASAVATSLTTVEVTFDRNIEPTSVLADGSDFTFDNGLTASAAAVSGKVVTVTTSTQTIGASYTVTVASAVTDTYGVALGTPSTASFTGYVVPNLFFMTYIEGSSNNKALEIYNGGTDAMDLAACTVKTYFNGAATTTTTQDLTGTLAVGGSFTICNSNFAIAVMDPATCDLSLGGGVVNFNGDDAIELFCAGSTVDVFGQIGTDPGASWSANGVNTQNMTLVRKCSVTQGDSNGADAFDPSVEWVAFAQDTVTNFGTGTCAP